MLDFYFIDDSQPKSSVRTRDLERAGSLDEDIFYHLQERGVIEPWFDYYSSFRWDSGQVALILGRLKRGPSSFIKDEKTFAAILQQAASNRKGLLAFGD